MKIKSVKRRKLKENERAWVTEVGDGYLQGASGSLPDVDIDFQSDRRQDVKEYLERRYNINGKQRVFSAGTFSALKIKAVFKDVCRIHGVPAKTANIITSRFDSDGMSWTGLMLQAFREKNEKGKRKYVYNFIKSYPEVISDIRYIMGQPKSASIHASAVIITPDEKDGKEAECFDFLPIKKMDGILVSEFDGYSIDDIGLLKNDVLGLKELAKLKAMINIVKREYGKEISIEGVASSKMDDKKTFEILAKGLTQFVFQFGSPGMTRFLVEMKPNHINDLIAATSLFRPAALESGSAEKYNDCKHGIVAPTYLWGTHEILKDTYGVLAYQEQLAQMAREIGGFSIAEGVRLVKLISKKKTDKIHEMKDKFMEGAKKNGCPEDDAVKIWDMIESGGSYLFNRSHATAYSVTSYIGAYLKANYPMAFYTVSLEWADDEEIAGLITEMDIASEATIVPPHINVSGGKIVADYESSKIYWSLSRVKMVGEVSLRRILNDREILGEYTSLKNFVERMFVKRLTEERVTKLRYIEGSVKLHTGEFFETGWDARRFLETKSMVYALMALDGVQFTEEQKKYLDVIDKENATGVTSETIRNLIFSGCFDELEGIDAVSERWVLMNEASEVGGFKLDPDIFPEDLVHRHYFWSTKQIELSGVGSVDFKRIYDNSKEKTKLKGRGLYMDLHNITEPENDGKRIICCAIIQSVEPFSYQDKKTGEEKYCCKLILSQNKSSTELVLWADIYETYKTTITPDVEGSILIGNCRVQYNDYQKENTLSAMSSSKIYIL